MPIFRYPFYYNNYSNYYNKAYLGQFNNSNSFRDNGSQIHPLHNNPSNFPTKTNQSNESNESILNCDVPKKNNSKKLDDSNYFFELFGLKLYSDDILLICLIFFLYQEGVKDDELFISLILLLLS